jgi:hypothetical protein
LANGIERKRIRNQWSPARRRWTKLGYDAIAVRDQHGFASSRQPDVFAELVFEQFDPDRPHALKVATGSYFVNRQHGLAQYGKANVLQTRFDSKDYRGPPWQPFIFRDRARTASLRPGYGRQVHDMIKRHLILMAVIPAYSVLNRVIH